MIKYTIMDYGSSLFFLVMYVFVSRKVFTTKSTVDRQELNNFIPVQVAEKSLYGRFQYSFTKTNEKDFFLIGTTSNLSARNKNGHFRLYEENRSKWLLRSEQQCLHHNRTIISDSDAVLLDIQNPSYEVWIVKVKEQSHGGCQGNRVQLKATEDEQYITSANFPKAYPAMVNCGWNITSIPGRDVHLTIYFMDIEIGPTTLCVFDHLKITSDNKAEVLCGEDIWTKKTWTGSSFLVDFISDFSGTRRGFLIGYQFKPQTKK